MASSVYPPGFVLGSKDRSGILLRTRDLENDLQGLRKCWIQGTFSQVKGSPGSRRQNASTRGPHLALRSASGTGGFQNEVYLQRRSRTGDLLNLCARCCVLCLGLKSSPMKPQMMLQASIQRDSS